MAPGFQVSVRPSSLVAGEWYVWTQTERSPRLLEGCLDFELHSATRPEVKLSTLGPWSCMLRSRASFNPDHNQEPWQLSAEELQAGVGFGSVCAQAKSEGQTVAGEEWGGARSGQHLPLGPKAVSVLWLCVKGVRWYN